MSGWWVCEVCVRLVLDGYEKRRTDKEGVEHIYCESCDKTLEMTP